MSILGEETFSLRRFAAGSTGADGRWASGSTTDVAIVGGLQTLAGPEKKFLPEGHRAQDYRVFLTHTELFTVDQATGGQADRIIADSKVYEVVSTEHVRQVIPHFFVILHHLREVAP